MVKTEPGPIAASPKSRGRRSAAPAAGFPAAGGRNSKAPDTSETVLTSLLRERQLQGRVLLGSTRLLARLHEIDTRRYVVPKIVHAVPRHLMGPRFRNLTLLQRPDETAVD